MNKSRRNFLRVAGISAFALGGGLTALEAAVAAVPGRFESGEKAIHAKRFSMVIDTRKFTSDADFDKVIKACHDAHNVPSIKGHQEIKWLWTDLYDRVFTDDMNEHLPQKMSKGKYLLLCNHCTNPPCVRVCPTQATYKMADGIIAMDYHRCIGCRFCMAGCPYGARSFNFMDPRPHLPENVPNPTYPTRMPGVVEKCTFCAERLAKGQKPACVEASGGAIMFGDLNDPASDVRKALEANYSIRRKPSLGTQPGVYYLV